MTLYNAIIWSQMTICKFPEYILTFLFNASTCVAGQTTIKHSVFVLIKISVKLGVLVAVSIKINFLGHGTSTLKMELIGSSETSTPTKQHGFPSLNKATFTILHLTIHS